MNESDKSQLHRLIEDSYQLETQASETQNLDLSDDVRAEAASALKRAYSTWQATADRYVPSADRPKFEDAYEGGTFTSRIKAFLARSLEKNPMFDSNNPLLPYFTLPANTAFAPNIGAQRQILLRVFSSIPATQPVQDSIKDLSDALTRFNSYMAALQVVTGPIEIPDELGLQKHLLAILRVLYDDVRPEDFVPDFGGGRSRSDFFLPAPGIAIEAKMKRPSLSPAKLRDELIVDFRQYASLGRALGIVAFVYDPDRRLSNPAALSDLSDLTADTPTYVVVVTGR